MSSTRKLTDAQVTAIRTSGLTDAWWSDKLRMRRQSIRAARQGLSYKHVITPPDTAPREGTGCTRDIRAGVPQKARPARLRRQWIGL